MSSRKAVNTNLSLACLIRRGNRTQVTDYAANFLTTHRCKLRMIILLVFITTRAAESVCTFNRPLPKSWKAFSVLLL